MASPRIDPHSRGTLHRWERGRWKVSRVPEFIVEASTDGVNWLEIAGFRSWKDSAEFMAHAVSNRANRATLYRTRQIETAEAGKEGK